MSEPTELQIRILREIARRLDAGVTNIESIAVASVLGIDHAVCSTEIGELVRGGYLEGTRTP